MQWPRQRQYQDSAQTHVTALACHRGNKAKCPLTSAGSLPWLQRQAGNTSRDSLAIWLDRLRLSVRNLSHVPLTPHPAPHIGIASMIRYGTKVDQCYLAT